MKKVISVVGARPNFIKIAPVYRAFLPYRDKVIHKICHTGQHFDANMSKIFFEELEIPEPDFNLGIHGGSHSQQVAGIMTAFEQVLLDEQPDLVLMDIQMPGMNGIDASRKIREWEDEQEKSHVPILAMTADLEIQQISHYGAAGMNGLLSKPVNRQKLEEAIQGWAVRRELDGDK